MCILPLRNYPFLLTFGNPHLVKLISEHPQSPRGMGKESRKWHKNSCSDAGSGNALVWICLPTFMCWKLNPPVQHCWELGTLRPVMKSWALCLQWIMLYSLEWYQSVIVKVDLDFSQLLSLFLAFPPSTMEWGNEKTWIRCRPLNLEFPSLQNCKKWISVIYKLPNPRYYVLAA